MQIRRNSVDFSGRNSGIVPGGIMIVFGRNIYFPFMPGSVYTLMQTYVLIELS